MAKVNNEKLTIFFCSSFFLLFLLHFNYYLSSFFIFANNNDSVLKNKQKTEKLKEKIINVAVVIRT